MCLRSCLLRLLFGALSLALFVVFLAWLLEVTVHWRVFGFSVAPLFDSIRAWLNAGLDLLAKLWRQLGPWLNQVAASPSPS
jgi:hypothetical protein